MNKIYLQSLIKIAPNKILIRVCFDGESIPYTVDIDELNLSGKIGSLISLPESYWKKINHNAWIAQSTHEAIAEYINNGSLELPRELKKFPDLSKK